jgi:hypothetical protein
MPTSLYFQLISLPLLTTADAPVSYDLDILDNARRTPAPTVPTALPRNHISLTETAHVRSITYERDETTLDRGESVAAAVLSQRIVNEAEDERLKSVQATNDSDAEQAKDGVGTNCFPKSR